MADAMHEITSPNADGIRADLLRFTARWGELGVPCWLEIRAFNRWGVPHIGRFRHTDIDGAVEWIVSMNGKLRLNIYAVRNPIRDASAGAAKDTDIIAAFYLWADCDDVASGDNIRRFDGPKYTAAVITGTIPSVRVHTYWELTAPVTDMAAWRDTQQAIARHFGSDGSVINPSRIMRVGGTISWPSDDKAARGYQPELTKFRSEYPVEDGREPISFERAQRVWPVAQAPLSQQAAATPPAGQAPGMFAFDMGHGDSLDRQTVIASITAGSEWHNNMIRLVGSYVGKGLGDAEIHALTQPLTLPGYSGDDTAREVQTAIDGARRKGWTPAPYAQPEAIGFDAAPNATPEAKVSRLEWFDDLRPALDAQYIIKGMIDAATMSVLYGPSNSGKTFFALDLAFHIALGAEWRGHRVNQGSVLYLAAEGGRGIVNRMTALRLTHGVCDVPLALRRAGLDLLRSTADLQEIVDLAAEVKAKTGRIDMLVIDTLSRVMAGGDENSAQDMTALIKNVDALRDVIGCHIMIVHHTGKDTARGARGHSSLRAATDTEIEVQNDDGARSALVTKQRDHAGGEDFPFNLVAVPLGTDCDGDQVTSAVVEAASHDEGRAMKARAKGMGANQQIIADTFDQMLGEGLGKPNGGGVGMPEPGAFWTVDADALRHHAQGKMTGADTGKLYRQAIKVLVMERKLFAQADKRVWRLDRPAGKSQ